MWVKTNGIPVWLVGEFTTHFRLPILVGLGPVHWGLTGLWILTPQEDHFRASPRHGWENKLAKGSTGIVSRQKHADLSINAVHHNYRESRLGEIRKTKPFLHLCLEVNLW